MWWILQIIGALGVTIALAPGRVWGFTWFTYLWYMIWAGTTASWMLTKSYQIAPSFIQAWFLCAGALAVFGFLVGVFLFHDSVNLYQLGGVILILVGSYLLII